MPKEQESNDFQLDSKQHFNSQDSQTFIFKQQDFLDFLKLRILDKSYTKFANKIGLSVNNELLKADSRVVLHFPYKDCVLKGGQSKDDEKSKEIFFNEILAGDEIDVLFEPKVLYNFEYIGGHYTQIAELEKENIKDSNLLIKGNNLIALHSLKNNPAIFGKVKLIYIDPPYNTGKDSFNYNDRFTHSAWLSFMKNRLDIAREFLREDGVIFVQCDDNEQAYLKVLCDEIFGRENFVSTFIWEKKRVRQNDAKWYSTNHEYILNYAKNKERFKPNPLERTNDMLKIYKNPDNDPRGLWVAIPLSAKSGTDSMKYTITFPNGVFYETKYGYPRYSKEKLMQMYNDNRLYFGKNGTSQPSAKKFLSEVRQGVVHNTFLRMEEVGSTQQSANEIKALFAESSYEVYPHSDTKNSHEVQTLEALSGQGIDKGEGATSPNSSPSPLSKEKSKQTPLFATPKPEALLKRIIEISTKEGDLVMDFFAGSGTTLAVAHKMNRKWVGVEQMDYIETITKVRLEKVIAGEQGGVSKAVGWQGGGEFVYCELMPLNAVYKEQILKAKNQAELESLYKDLQTKAFLDYRVDLAEVLKDKDFKDLDLESKKVFLIQALDSNMDYVPLGDIKDSTYNVSSEVIALNKAFYGEENE